MTSQPKGPQQANHHQAAKRLSESRQHQQKVSFATFLRTAMNVHDEETQAPNKMCSISLFIRPRKERRQTEGRETDRRKGSCLWRLQRPATQACSCSKYWVWPRGRGKGEKCQGAWPNKGVRVVTYFKRIIQFFDALR